MGKDLITLFGITFPKLIGCLYHIIIVIVIFIIHQHQTLLGIKCQSADIVRGRLIIIIILIYKPIIIIIFIRITLLGIKRQPVDIIGGRSASHSHNVVSSQWDCLLLNLSTVNMVTMRSSKMMLLMI